MVPIGAELLYAILMELYGRPMLSMMLDSSDAGTVWRMEVSMRSPSRAVSSMRVAVLARKWRLNWPASVTGKKS